MGEIETAAHRNHLGLDRRREIGECVDVDCVRAGIDGRFVSHKPVEPSCAGRMMGDVPAVVVPRDWVK
jgi:hypothetical protein